MNCSDFEAIVMEIARDGLMEVATRERGLEHVQRCPRCATLLVEERALSRDLRALSAQDAAEEIPERVETALLAAFRRSARRSRWVERTRRSALAAVAPRRRRWLMVVAALALLTFGISLATRIASPPEREPASSTEGGSPHAAATTPGLAGKTPPPMVEVRRPDPRLTALTSGKRRKRLVGASADRRATSDDAPREFVTRFFPLTQGDDLIPLEGGQVVRVRMPRSNLIPLGIPLNQERASEAIKADVLVSNDGLARAIRFVY